MRRVLLSLVILLGAVLAAAYVMRGDIALKVMPYLARQAMQHDFVAEQVDGLHVVLIGAGGPIFDPLRSGPCVAVIAGKSLFLVDAGASAARNLQRVGITPGAVRAVFLTHYHSDHIDGLGELMLQRWVTLSNVAPLPVIGPIGVTEVVAGFNLAYRQDAELRTRHHGAAVAPPSGAGGTARPFAQPLVGQAVVVWRDQGLMVRAFRVDHGPVDPAVGYRFDYGGRSLLISGDTRRSANLQHFATGVDLLVHEALAPQLVKILHDAAQAVDRPGLAKVLSDIPGYHTPPVQAAQIATAARVKQLLFYHVLPPLVAPGAEAAFMQGVRNAFNGAATLGRDGTMISLPAQSTSIQVRNLL